MRTFNVFLPMLALIMLGAAPGGATPGIGAGRAAQDVPCGYLGERRLTGGVGEERLTVTAEQGGWLVIEMWREPGGQASGDLDPLVRLLDAGGAVLAVDDDSGGDRDAYLRYENLPYTGLYTVVATRYGGSGLYHLYVDSSSCGMGGQGGDGNLLCGGGAVTGWLSDSIGNLLDNYSMKAAAGNRLEISVRRDSGDIALSAELLEVRSGVPYNLNRSTVFGDAFASGQAGKSVALSADIRRTGDYVLRVYGPAGADGRYTVACQIGTTAGSGGQPSSVEAARIDWPPDGTTLSGWVDIRGAASMKRFQYYKFEFEDTRCARGVCHVATMRQPVTGGVLMHWDTRSVPNGTYTLKLSVVNQSGIVFRDTPRARITIRN